VRDKTVQVKLTNNSSSTAIKSSCIDMNQSLIESLDNVLFHACPSVAILLLVHKLQTNLFKPAKHLNSFVLHCMGHQNHDILLLINNFSGHFINYVLQNIEIVYFTPNITSHIQPLDAGTIRCFKVWYRQFFCEHAIELDNANEPNIYKINLLESMQIAERAWTMVALQTIKNCWKHTGIVPEDARGVAEVSSMEQVGWNIVHVFAELEMTLPNAEMVLWMALAGLYRDEDWREALNMVNNTEPDSAEDLPQHIRRGQRPDSGCF
jgi:hypothetical protein